jgi:hypothetical protein
MCILLALIFTGDGVSQYGNKLLAGQLKSLSSIPGMGDRFYFFRVPKLALGPIQHLI